MDEIINLFTDNLTLIFYLTIILLVYINRKKFDIQARIIALYRTKVGLKLMENTASKYREFIKILGYCGVGIGFIGMVLISYTFANNLYKLIADSTAQSEVALVLPGVKVPGSPIFIPLIMGWVALFIVIAVHEFSHGIVALANNLRVKSSGIVFFGPLMGAFVEPDEKKLVKQDPIVQYSLFAAGPFSNILLAVIIILASSALILPVFDKISQPSGFSIETILPDTPASSAGLTPGLTFLQVNSQPANNFSVFFQELQNIKPNQTITLTTLQKTYTILTVAHPDNQSQGYIGVQGFENEYTLHPSFSWLQPIHPIELILFIAEFTTLTAILSLGIGLANLLPLGPTDGGRMLQIAFTSIYGTKKGNNYWKQVSVFFLVILLANIALGLARSFGLF
ncbi:MAG: site-2 protease family protein [Candidatus Woesearchaeota archaeon]